MKLSEIICLGIAVLIILAVFYYRYKTNKPTEEQKEEAKKFLDKITNNLLEIAIKTVKEADASMYLDIDDFLDDVLDSISDSCWDCVEETLRTEFGKDERFSVFVKLIDRDSVDRIVDGLIASNSITSSISVIFEECVKAKIDAMEEEEKKAAEIAEAYENGTIDGIEEYVEPKEEKKVEEPEELPDSVEYSEDDPSIEVLHQAEVVEELSED